MSIFHKILVLLVVAWVPVQAIGHQAPSISDAIEVELAAILGHPHEYKHQYVKTRGYFLYSEDSKEFVLSSGSSVNLTREVFINREVLPLASAKLSNQDLHGTYLSRVGNLVVVYGYIEVWDGAHTIVLLSEANIEQ